MAEKGVNLNWFITGKGEIMENAEILRIELEEIQSMKKHIEDLTEANNAYKVLLKNSL